jgi:hypothetical protein
VLRDVGTMGCGRSDMCLGTWVPWVVVGVMVLEVVIGVLRSNDSCGRSDGYVMRS